MSDPKKDPLESLPNIEEPQGRKLNALEELSMIKAGYYSARANLDLTFEQTLGNLYAELLQKNQINSVLQKENVELKKENEKFKELRKKASQ